MTQDYITYKLDKPRIICYNLYQIAKRANKRFYFNGVKREKKRIIKRAEINRKKVREHGEIEEDSCILIDFII